MNPSIQLIITLMLATGVLACALWLNARAKERRVQKQAREARRQVRRLTYGERRGSTNIDAKSRSVTSTAVPAESALRGGE
ncbi:MAG: hypothetical protein NXH85_12545 [Pseudomonadaceae bacterium]|nr:hypothetical protein [Pseudomonadaceae bacterium]